MSDDIPTLITAKTVGVDQLSSFDANGDPGPGVELNHALAEVKRLTAENRRLLKGGAEAWLKMAEERDTLLAENAELKRVGREQMKLVNDLTVQNEDSPEQRLKQIENKLDKLLNELCPDTEEPCRHENTMLLQEYYKSLGIDQDTGNHLFCKDCYRIIYVSKASFYILANQNP